MNIILWIVIGTVLFISFFLIITYNNLIKWRNRAQEAWADIDVQLKRRYNLIPNLVETVKAYAKHEREVFEKVTQARTQALLAQKAQDPKAVGQAENVLTGALKTLFALAENYPDLKATRNFLELQDELTDTENKIQAARRFYNTVVRDYNIQIQRFPSNLVASLFKFRTKEFFEIKDEKEKEVVKVKF